MSAKESEREGIDLNGASRDGRRGVWIAATVGALFVGAAFGGSAWNAQAQASAGGAQFSPWKCSNKTLKGAWGVQIEGERPVLGGTGMERVIGVVSRTYDGAGNFVQYDNVKGSVTGFQPDRPGSGTYEVTPDCLATTRFQPAPGVTVEERMIILDYGHEVRSIVSSPKGIMVTSVGKRIGFR